MALAGTLPLLSDARTTGTRPRARLASGAWVTASAVLLTVPLVAVTLLVPSAEAVNRPALLIVPTPETDQVTPLGG